MKPLLTALALALLAAPIFAQDSSNPDTERRVLELERKLEILSKQMESQATGMQPEAPEQGRYGLGSGASKVYESKGGLSIGGYGEFLYSNLESRVQDGSHAPNERSVDALRLILYTGYKFSDKIVFNSEVEFEHGGYSDEHKEGEVKVEFAYLDFLLNKAVNLRAGMVLLPIGFINEQHEPPAFLGSRRPLTETIIIPSTWHENGIGIHGDLPANFSYQLYFVNGLSALGKGEEGETEGFSAAGIKGGRQAGKKANATSLGWTGRLDWSFMPGAQVGASFYTGNSNQSGEGKAIRTTLLDIHAEYRAGGLQLRGIYATITNSKAGVEAIATGLPAREVGTRQFGGYLEAGYDLLRGGKQALVPFLRWERMNTQADVVSGVVAAGANDLTVLTVGLNYKPIPNVAVKADYQKLENHARSGRNQFNVALGYYF
jgi:hypothetical protein